ncbi:hypothetical protein OG589_14510 [Sphaerisporangium sp. NBC_01403]|uniref:hypothetical protein n=1 Tax=Sphaerisporangium sp. NBC_01403 TaxID=2903599 RepID=UPI0032513655
MPLSASLLVQLAADLTSPLDLTTVDVPLSIGRQISLISGTGAGAADQIWSATRSINSGATDSLDLAGVLTSPLGGTLTFARIKGVLVAAAATNTTNVDVARPATNGVPLFSAVSSAISVRPGGLLVWMDPSAAGVVVTPGTGDLINLVNGSGATAKCDVVIIGASA